VVSYKEYNPALWEVKVKASKPFLLVFAKAYDTLWEAKVYKDEKLVEVVESTPVYSIVNGFWINETGNLTIVIRYVPQDWFELGLRISVLTFAVCVFYLVWDWRSRGDRWALWLAGVFGGVFRAVAGVLGGFVRGSGCGGLDSDCVVE
jgi:hypothetical protein